MTLSARAKTFCGIVRPICFAVFRLMTSSNFVGCSTGSSGRLHAFENFVQVESGAAKSRKIVGSRSRAVGMSRSKSGSPMIF
jgi:hypothetical protein